MFTGKTKNLGVMGWPVAHSFSPAMQNAALEAAGLDYAYVALPVEPANLEAALTGVRALGFRGINVTIPHKRAVMPLLDEVSEEAKIIGAVNTVVNDHGRLKGYNTDSYGFVTALSAKGFSPEGVTAVVLGAGGAARAAVRGLVSRGARRIRLGVRNPERGAELAEVFAGKADIRAMDWNSEEFYAFLGQAELLVNATPLGMMPNANEMPPVPLEKLRPGAFVYDLIYTPAKTKLLQEAAVRQHPTLNGLAMLIHQGAAAFKLWTGQKADIEVMGAALRGVLEKLK